MFPDLTDTRGRPFSRRDVIVAMGVNTLAATLGSAWLAMTYTMPLIMYMQAIGASGLVIGLVSTIRMAAISAQIPAALATEHLEARKPFWTWSALTHRLLWFAIAALAFWCPASRWWLPAAILVLIAASEALGNASTAPWLSWMADLIPLPIAGRFWGIRQSVSTVATLAGLVLAGQILDATRNPLTAEAQPRGFAIVFAIAAALGVSDILVHLFIREPRPAPFAHGRRVHHRILAPLAQRNFRLLTFALGAWNFGISMIVAFALVYLKRDFAVTYSQLAALSVAGALGAIVTGYSFGAVMDRIGARNLGAIVFLAVPFSLLTWLFIDHSTVTLGPFRFPQSIALLCLSGMVTGAFVAAVNLCQFRLASELSVPEGRTMAMAVHWSFSGLLAAVGPTAGGLIMDRFPIHCSLKIYSGLPFTFYQAQLILFTALIWLVALPLLIAIRAPRHEAVPHPASP
jgi:MFS family permease